MSVSLREKVANLLYENRKEDWDNTAEKVISLIGKCATEQKEFKKELDFVMKDSKKELKTMADNTSSTYKQFKPIPAEKKDEDMPSQVADTLISDEERFNLLMKLNKE